MSACVGPGGKVITFEPNPQNAAVIHTNVRLNKTGNVMIEQMAVGFKDEKAVVLNSSNSVVIPSRPGGDARLTYQARRFFPERREVTMTSLDSYARLRDVHPTVLKIDVEGYEVEVLKGAKELLRPHRMSRLKKKKVIVKHLAPA